MDRAHKFNNRATLTAALVGIFLIVGATLLSHTNLLAAYFNDGVDKDTIVMAAPDMVQCAIEDVKVEQESYFVSCAGFF